MRLGSLCSGAGGLDMAVEQVFGATTAWHCEINDAASAVLAHRYPGVPNHRDLTTTDWDTVEPVDILTGGYPCQPFSAAGKRKGADDERHIWPDIREAIRRLRPRITFLENVAGHRSLGFDRVLGDLAEDGLHARWVSLRAADIGSCHGRERLWIAIADPARDGWAWFHDRAGGASARRGRERITARGAGRPTADVELLPTPMARDWRGAGPADMERKSPNLSAIVDLLPTPSAADGGGGHLTRSGARSSELLLPGVARAFARGELLPTPAAADAERGPDFARAGREGSGGDDLVTICARATREIGSNWGKYEPAIKRWEALTRPAPSPTEPNSKGNPRLNPAFSGWMMGWPAGWVTDVPGISRNDQLRIIGNGVVPQCAAVALRWLLSVELAA